jgi:hypothetical protein
MHIEEESENYYDHFIQKLRSEQEKIKLIGKPLEFDVKTPFKEYFKTFDCLYVEDGWQIDCYYSHSFTSGKPVIYVRKPYENIEDLISCIDNKGYRYDHRIYDYCETVKTLDHLKVTDIHKGLFQLLMLDIIGEDFAIFWHAGYGHIDIICSKRDFDQLGERIPDAKQKSEIEKTNGFPTVEENYESITFKILTFHAWGGLEERAYNVKKEFPHKISLLESKILVEYDCGLRY